MSDETIAVTDSLDLTAGEGPAGSAETALRDRSLKRNSLHALAVRVVGTVSALGAQMILARALSLSEYGAYTYAATWMPVLSLVGAIGLHMTALRFVAAYRATGQWALLRGLLRRSAVLVLPGSLVIAAALAAIALLARRQMSPSLVWAFILVAVNIPLMGEIMLFRNVLCGLGRILEAQSLALTARPVGIGVAVGVLWWTGWWDLTAPRTMAVQLGVSMGILALAAFWVVRHLPSEVRHVPPAYAQRQWLATGLPMTFNSGLQMLHGNCDVLMIGVMFGTKEAGVYFAANRLAQLVGFGPLSVNVGLSPVISELHARDRRDELQRCLRKAAGEMILLSLPVAAVLVLAGRPALRLFGEAFVPAYGAMAILIVGRLAHALNAGGDYLLTMTGHERWAAVVMALTTGVNVALNLALIPLMGIMGAAVAATIAVAAEAGVVHGLSRRLLGVTPSVWAGADGNGRA